MRTFLAAALAALSACTFTPDVTSLKPRTDCPSGQKACGYRCVAADDPASGCAASTCLPCPGSPAGTVAICGSDHACGLACAEGFAPADGNPAHGCSACASGQKACNSHCAAVGDPATGCAASTCTPCSGGPSGTVAICDADNACGLACAEGLGAADGNPAHGCAACSGDRKLCGSQCAAKGDPSTGCGAAACAPCPEGPAGSVAACQSDGACGFACAEGLGAADGNPAHGCALCASGQKTCNSRCVSASDPSMGCAASGCTACPSGSSGTVAVCQSDGACGLSCAEGLGAADGNPAHGCAACGSDKKLCGLQCVAKGDPSTGCGAAACTPCPAGPAGTVALCAANSACGVACSTGYAAADGNPAHGCIAVAGDPANCGAKGHACEAGQACTGGLCATGTAVVSTGEAPRGLALTPTAYAWTTDPPVAGGIAPKGALHRVAKATAAALEGADGFGHATWVRAAGGEFLAVGGTDPSDGGPLSWLVDPSTSPLTVDRMGGGQVAGALVAGLALTPDLIVTVIQNGADALVDYSSYDGRSTGALRIAFDNGDIQMLFALGQGAGFLWLGGQEGVFRISADLANGVDPVAAGGVYFGTALPVPRPDRTAARAGPTASDPVEVYFADLSDGSVWTGRTTGKPNTVPPWRVVQGDGKRTQMDLAADDKGVVWSDFDKGEIWALPAGEQPYLLATGRPWAIALTATRVYWTDVDAKAIRWVAR